MAVFGGRINKDVNVFSDGDHTYSVTRFTSGAVAADDGASTSRRRDHQPGLNSTSSDNPQSSESGDNQKVIYQNITPADRFNRQPSGVYKFDVNSERSSRASVNSAAGYPDHPSETMSGGVRNNNGNADQKSVFVSNISVRDAKPPPIPLSGLGGNVGFTISTHYSPGHVQHVWQGGRSPPDGRNVVIGVGPQPASQVSFTNSAVQNSSPGRSHQISVQYHPVVNSGQQTGSSSSTYYASPRSSVDVGGDSVSGQTQSNTAFLRSASLRSPGANTADVVYSNVRMIGGQERIPVQISEPVSAAYTDPRQRTLPPQSNVSVHTSTYATSVNDQRMNPASNDGVQVILSSNTGTRLNNPTSLDIENSASSISVRRPLLSSHTTSTSSVDAEKAVAALTQQLERDLSMNNSPSTKSPDESTGSPTTRDVEPPPPYHGPHDVQTSVKYSIQQSQPHRSNVRLVAPVQGVQVQAGSVASVAKSPGMKSHLAFQVTPPKSKGPSDAEKKLAALTQQLEDEMDHLASGDYFGKALYCCIL